MEVMGLKFLELNHRGKTRSYNEAKDKDNFSFKNQKNY